MKTRIILLVFMCLAVTRFGAAQEKDTVNAVNKMINEANDFYSVGKQLVGDIIDSLISANQAYTKSTGLYSEGKLKQTISILEPLIENKKKMRALSRDARAEVYRVAAQSYFILNQSEKATYCIKEMLAYRPNYKDEMRDDDLTLFKEKVKSLNALPQLMIGVTAGGNMTLPTEVKTYPILISNDYNFYQSQYKESFQGYQLGVSGEFAVTKRISINAGLKYISQSYAYEIAFGSDLFKHSYRQSLNYFETPLLLRFQFFPYTKLKPFAEGGVFVKNLLNSNRKTTENENAISDLPITQAFNETDFGVAFGGGIGYFMKESCFKLNVRWLSGINEIVDEKNRLINDGLVNTFTYGYYDNMSNPRLNNLQVSLSYYYYLTHKVFR